MRQDMNAMQKNNNLSHIIIRKSKFPMFASHMIRSLFDERLLNHNKNIPREFIPINVEHYEPVSTDIILDRIEQAFGSEFDSDFLNGFTRLSFIRAIFSFDISER